MVIEKIRQARTKRPQLKETKPHSFKVNDMVLVKDPDSAVFEPRYQQNYWVMAIFGDNRIEVQDEKGHKSVRRSSHVKYMEPNEKVVHQLPSKEILQKYGRSSKLVIAAKDIPDLQFKVNRNSEFSEQSQNSLNPVGEVVEVMEMNVLPQTVNELSTVNLQSSKNCEQLGDSLTSVVKFAGDSAGGVSEYHNFQQKSTRSEVGVTPKESTEKIALQDCRKQQLNAGRTLKQSNDSPCSSPE